jgi:hypothetical protein
VRWRRLGKVKGKPEDLNVGLPHSDETGRDECIHQPVESEGVNAMGIDLTRLITNDDNFQAMLRLDLGNEAKHLWIRLRLSKHKVPKLIPGKWPLLKEHHPSQVFFEGELTLLVCLEDETMTLIHLYPIQFEVFGRSFARKVVPTVGEQDPANIYKQRRDWERLLHFSLPACEEAIAACWDSKAGRCPKAGPRFKQPRNRCPNVQRAPA